MNPPDWLGALFASVLRTSLHGALLILIVWGVQRIVRRRLGPAWTFALWGLVLVRLSLPSLPESRWSWQSWGVSRLPESVARWMAVETVKPARIPAPTTKASEPATALNVSSGVGATVGGHRGEVGVPSEVALTGFEVAPSAQVMRGRENAWLAWTGLVWGVVMAVLLLKQGFLAVMSRTRLRSYPRLEDPALCELAERCREELGVACRVEIRVGHDAEAPGLSGWLKPVILVPSGLIGRLGNDAWRHVFRHEFAHVRRRDILWNAWLTVLTGVHWFNPMVWWGARRMRQDRELACDALALRGADSGTRRAYGETLLELATLPPMPGSTETLMGIREHAASLGERLKSLRQVPRGVWVPTLLGIGIVSVLAASWLTRAPVLNQAATDGLATDGGPGGSADGTGDASVAGSQEPKAMRGAVVGALELGRHTDSPVEAVDPSVLHVVEDQPGMWWAIPRGSQSFFGVPFSVSGLIRLAGTDARREGWFFRPRVEGIVVGGTFDRLYLLHSTYFHANLETTIARIRLNYADGSTAEIPIQYGTHVLNFWRQRYESASNLGDSESRVAWTGDAPHLAAYGNSMRLCVSSFWNPHPGKPVRTLDVVSAGSTASEVIVGMSVGGPELPVEWRETPIVRVPEVPWDGRLRFRAVDSETGEAIAGMRLRLEVAEPGAHCRIASYDTGADGWVEVRYPKAPLDYITLWANHDAYVPRIVQWTRRQHGEFPDEYVYRAEPGLMIQGRIVDEQERPVSGALVRIEGPRQDFAGDAKEFLMLTQILTFSDDSGRWQSRVIPRELPAEFIRVEVLHPGFPTRSLHVVTADEKRGAEIRIQMNGGMTLQGRVVDAGNRPVSGAMVRLGHTDARENMTVKRGAVARTDASGAFTLRSAADPSTQVLGVEAEGFAPLVVPVSDDLEGVMQAPVVLQPGRSVRIAVRDEANEPIPGVLLTGRILNGGWPFSARLTTDEQGRAVWANAPSMDWLVEASIEGFGRAFVVVMPGMDELGIQLTRTQELTGTVQDKTTALPVPLFRVWVGTMPFDSDEIEWEPQPLAMGREGRFRVAHFERFGTNYRFDAPGYRMSEALTAAKLSARTTPIELEPLGTP